MAISKEEVRNRVEMLRGFLALKGIVNAIAAASGTIADEKVDQAAKDFEQWINDAVARVGKDMENE